MCPNSQDPTECKRKFPKVHFSGLLANRALDNQVGGGDYLLPYQKPQQPQKKAFSWARVDCKNLSPSLGGNYSFPYRGNSKEHVFLKGANWAVSSFPNAQISILRSGDRRWLSFLIFPSLQTLRGAGGAPAGRSGRVARRAADRAPPPAAVAGLRACGLRRGR